jgi:hypothetical protein
MTWLLVEYVLVIEDGVGRLHKRRRQPAHPRLKHELPGPVRPTIRMMKNVKNKEMEIFNNKKTL